MSKTRKTSTSQDPCVGSGGRAATECIRTLSCSTLKTEVLLGAGRDDPGRRVKVSVLSRVLRVDITEEVTFEQRLAEGEGVSYVGVFRRVFWKGGNPAKALRNSLQGSVGVAEAGRAGEGGV